MRNRSAPKLPQTVSFRLPDLYMEQLLTRAEAGRVSPGEFVRQVLIDYLEDEQRVRLEEGIRGLQAELAFLRGDFNTTVEALLVLAGAGTVKPMEAQAWVEDRLRQARPGGT